MQIDWFLRRNRQATTDYSVSGALLLLWALHNNAEIFVRLINKEYKNESATLFNNTNLKVVKNRTIK